MTRDDAINILLEHFSEGMVRTIVDALIEDEPVAMRYDFDGYGYQYIDFGSGSDWQTREKGAEPLYTAPQPKQEQGEPVAYFNPQKGGFYWAKPTKVEAPVSVDVEPLPLYTTPQTKGCDECGIGGGYALYCLVCAEKFFGKGKEWVGLTEEDLKPICDEWRIIYGGWVDNFAKEIEDKLKDKNT